MPFYAPNPNAFPPAPSSQQMFPAPGSPATNDLLQMWGQYRRAAPWLFGDPGGGLFNRVPDQFPLVPNAERGMLQPVADIYSFTKKGLLGVPGTEGAGGRGLGSRGGGLLGGRYNFRDPSSVAQYEKDRGLPPGSIKPVEAQVTTIAPPGGGPQRDFGKYNAKVTDPRMLTPEARNKAKFESALQEHRMTPKPTRQQAMDKFQKAIGHPSPAQMARPVKQTPEISARLKDARFARWAIGHAGPSWKNLSPEQLTALRQAWEQVHGGK